MNDEKEDEKKKDEEEIIIIYDLWISYCFFIVGFVPLELPDGMSHTSGCSGSDKHIWLMLL